MEKVNQKSCMWRHKNEGLSIYFFWFSFPLLLSSLSFLWRHMGDFWETSNTCNCSAVIPFLQDLTTDIQAKITATNTILFVVISDLNKNDNPYNKVTECLSVYGLYRRISLTAEPRENAPRKNSTKFSYLSIIVT